MGRAVTATTKLFLLLETRNASNLDSGSHLLFNLVWAFYCLECDEAIMVDYPVGQSFPGGVTSPKSPGEGVLEKAGWIFHHSLRVIVKAQKYK